MPFAGAKALGCKVVNIGHEDLVEGNVDLILGLVWQLIRAYLMKSVNLARYML
jgi:plastin-1